MSLEASRDRVVKQLLRALATMMGARDHYDTFVAKYETMNEDERKAFMLKCLDEIKAKIQ